MQNNSDFAPHHSTEHAILSIVDKIHEGIEKGMFSCGIFFDFSKAFDTVNHAILVRKLEQYGIRGIAKDWFVSYLSNRKQFTSIGNTNSEELPISCQWCSSWFSAWPSAISYLY